MPFATLEKAQKKPAMINITLNMPLPYLAAIDKLIKAKRVASRSEAIRTATYNFLREDISFLNRIMNKDL